MNLKLKLTLIFVACVLIAYVVVAKYLPEVQANWTGI